MNILFVASEVEPYAKSGGLADVAAALPKALAELGHNVKVILPLYSSIKYDKYNLKLIMPQTCVHMGTCEEWFNVHHTAEPHGIDVYFIEFNKYFARTGYYHDSAGEYRDNAFRFAFLCRAAMQTVKDMDFKPDVVHVHDWQTSLLPYYLKKGYDSFFSGTKSVLTLHNMGYQGIFSSDVLSYAMVRDYDFKPDTFEAYGGINMLKGGIVYADKLTTVSPTYAEEIRGPIGSNGLDPYLNRRGADLSGILNGIDTTIWNPSSDRLIPTNYTVKNFTDGKRRNKKALQQQFLLETNPELPLFSFIGRFAEQKGLNLLMDSIDSVMNDMDCQFIILGSGDTVLERFFGELPKRYAGRVGSFIGYSEPTAHIIEAGSDFFIMPSLYEPCGLNQMYSQAYGTLPVVRATGGLADTIEQYDEKRGTGTGFKFDYMAARSLYDTIGWAVSTFFDRPAHMNNMITAAMKKDYSWKRSAQLYYELYKEAVGK
ncbi:MAG: glycogen synthase GlgA [Deferribacteraceae bacterium]|jgi:starch synthase|nr:glycogen synthase GlgA [Deferribacteraceae bacterium]